MTTPLAVLRAKVMALYEAPDAGNEAAYIYNGALKQVLYWIDGLTDSPPQYFLFSYADSYPSGGAGDCIGVYATLEEAKAAAKDDPRTSRDTTEIAMIEGGQLVVMYWLDDTWWPAEDGAP